jgi:hypothetical protein
MFRFLTAGSLAALALSGCVNGGNFDFGDTVHATVHERFAARGDVHVTVGNVSGDVKILPWDQPTIDILAVKRAGSRQGLRRVTIEIVRDQTPAQSVEIRTRYEHEWFGNNGGSVDYTIRVPRRASLDINEVSGDVVASGVGGNLHVHSVSGDVTALNVGGSLVVNSVSGDVRLSMLRMGGDRNADVNTISGDIHLALPASAGAFVDAKSISGDFDSTWPLQVEHHMVGVEASGTIGRGGGDVELKSISGDIHLERDS